MVRSPARPTLQLVRVHHSQIECMVAVDTHTSFFNHDIDAGHVVLLLLLATQLEAIVQANNTAFEVSAGVSRRIETLDSENRRLSQHEPRAADSSGPPPRRAGSEREERQEQRRTALNPPLSRHAGITLPAHA